MPYEWFVFKSRKQKEEERKAYFRKMFPLGEEQKDWETNMISQVFPTKKRDWKELHFCLLILREGLINSTLPEDAKDHITLSAAMNIWQGNTVVKSFSAEDLKKILAMARLEMAAAGKGDMSAFPNAELIEVTAENISEF